MDGCLDAPNGTVLAGESGVAGAWSYQFSNPTSITFDRFGSMYIMDSGNNRIQRWSPGSTYGVTVASAAMSNPRGLSFDTYGNLVVADLSNHRVLSFPVSCRKYRSHSYGKERVLRKTSSKTHFQRHILSGDIAENYKRQDLVRSLHSSDLDDDDGASDK